jgi:enoyl-CoA hydratase/carnithine racemase
MSAHDDFIYEVRDGVAILTLNRPEKGNAFTLDMKAGLREAWEDVRDNDAVRVAIITGAGERHFCTGADVAKTAEVGSASAGGRPMSEENLLTNRQNRVWKPVICAVNGMAVGGGLHFVVDADIILASTTAQFLDSHVNVGFVGAVENIGLSRRLPLGTALRMSLVGRDYRLSAQRAYELGLVEEVLPPERLMDAALEMANTIKKNSPTAMALTQEAIWRSLDMPLEAALEFGWALIRMHWSHPDYIEGPRAFAEKREPQWSELTPRNAWRDDSGA